VSDPTNPNPDATGNGTIQISYTTLVVAAFTG
jgi:hypothetical protein